MKKIFLLLICSVLVVSSCKIMRFIVYNFADVKDYEKFPERGLKASSNPFMFYSKTNQAFPQSITYNGKTDRLDKFLSEENTLAFMVIRNDTILYENYFHDKDETVIVPSFSMAKSFTSALIGCAIADGLIQSVEEPVTNYIPELKKNGFDKMKNYYSLITRKNMDTSANGV